MSLGFLTDTVHIQEQRELILTNKSGPPIADL